VSPTARSGKRLVIEAGGGVLWRDTERGREIAVVHRPRYDDWSLPKGKRKPGEELLLTAVREVTEETGHTGEVGPYLGQYSYPITSTGRPAIKSVKYWAMQDTGGDFEANDEVDEVAWLSMAAAAERMQFPVDVQVLRVFRQLPDTTSVLLVVRNGSAVRASRRVDAERRALDRRGKDQAVALVPVLTTLGVDTLLSTQARRCLLTLQPYARSIEADVRVDPVLRGVLRGGAYTSAAIDRLLELIGVGRRVAVCAEGAVTNSLIATLGAQFGARMSGQATIKKGGWCLLHVGAGELLSIERQEAA